MYFLGYSPSHPVAGSSTTRSGSRASMGRKESLSNVNPAENHQHSRSPAPSQQSSPPNGSRKPDSLPISRAGSTTAAPTETTNTSTVSSSAPQPPPSTNNNPSPPNQSQPTAAATASNPPPPGTNPPAPLMLV